MASSHRMMPYRNPFNYLDSHKGLKYIPRPLPREASSLNRLKQQHNKDRRALICAARLQVHQKTPSKTSETTPESSVVKTKQKHQEPFIPTSNMTDFTSLVENNKKTSSPIDIYQGESFSSIRNAKVQRTGRHSLDSHILSMSSLESSLPVLPLTNVGSKPADLRSYSCSQQALIDDMSVDELAGYLDDFVHIPKKMSSMAEMMYT